MLDQSFSSSNFNLIFFKENRKGTIKKRYLNQEYFDKHDEFKKVMEEKIALKNSKISGVLTQIEIEDFAARLEEINKEKEEIRENLFYDYSKKVNDEKNPFCYDVKYDIQKKIYTTNKDGVHFFALKQLQTNLRKTFKVIQADRNKIIKQTYNSLSDGFPKIIIKTDISKFYESIPQIKLFEKIENNTLLSPLSKKLLKRLFFEFEKIKDVTIMQPKQGIPRGLGISAYLSELYMREIDREIKLLPDIIYYARYVDDIIAIFSPKTKSQTRNYQSEIKEIINNEGLEINDNLGCKKNKTQNITLFFDKNKIKTDVEKYELTFLGYKFKIEHYPKGYKIFPKTDIKIELSETRMDRYKNRIISSIETYNKDSKFNEKTARKLFFDRLKFLCGNYKLNHNKKDIKSGIYYSNKMLELAGDKESLTKLNNELSIALSNINFPSAIGINKAHLIDFIKNKFCFEKGFNEKEKYYYSFNFNSKEQFYYNKKFKRVTNKFEVIKSIWKDE